MADPFAKWTGSKAWFVRGHLDKLPAQFKRARSAFTGMGAIELHMLETSPDMVLADNEPRLVNVWQVVKADPEGLIRELALLTKILGYNRPTFERIRAAVNAGSGTEVERAARFLVIIFWGFNGLWRTAGPRSECNVAFGKPPKEGGDPPKLGDPEKIRAASKVLQKAVIVSQDFAPTMANAQRGDFVILDSPYDPLTVTASFTAYGGGNWGKANADAQVSLFGASVDLDEQDRLAQEARKLDARGVKFLHFNQGTKRIRRLYAGFEQIPVEVARNGSCDAEGREPVTELMIRNYG